MQNNAVNFANASTPYSHAADPDWIKSAHAAGFSSDALSREDCITIRNKTNVKLPRWLMKDKMRRIGRGMYAVPELAAYAAQQNNKGTT